MLAFSDYDLPFTICTDASALGIGTVLMQQGDGLRLHVIAYTSRTLSDAESRYSVTHLKTLAVIWVLKHFRDIIYGYSSTVYTDHSAVTQLFKGKNLSGRLTCWFLTIEEFNPVLKYLPCKANVVVDALSRNVPVASVETIHNFSLQDLSVAQCSDPVWSAVIYALGPVSQSSGNVPNQRPYQPGNRCNQCDDPISQSFFLGNEHHQPGNDHNKTTTRDAELLVCRSSGRCKHWISWEGSAAHIWPNVTVVGLRQENKTILLDSTYHDSTNKKRKAWK